MFARLCVCVLVFLSASRADAADDDGDEGDEGPAGNPVSARSACKPVPSTMGLCSGIGYGEMRLPNPLGHSSAREAQQQSAAWTPLLGKHCHRDTRRFLCALYAPVCLPEVAAPVLPCRALCEAVRDACEPVMSAFGFPWPEMFNCSRFPEGKELCIPGERDPNREESTDATEGMCEVCRAGEQEIQQNFCKSQFAVRLRIGSWTRLGSDVCVAPEGRSRVLRWLGGPREMSCLWLPHGCSCPALDGRTDGSFIALGHSENGRLLLGRLLRWTRDERELKKFIRTLLRQDC
ncbi:secreted frizzled-related protein 2-like [Puntigrus tetrazona]|uniref:secreted frizzled-related protein 2-like n=1 Tax=Puntigrus tetrazona TaxID=1606681 RepID=UPI001C8A8555|nr:secreted frizzled-related protein 2-like [Puntigrus tetrazona]XP_043086341.1 secreted frizzled-related protein 2-like [Puntigrus tetrazona]